MKDEKPKKPWAKSMMEGLRETRIGSLLDALIYSATTQQRIVGGIDYGINLLQSNVSFDHGYSFWHLDQDLECNTKIKD